MKLTDRSAAAAVLPAGKTDHVYWDDDMPGFGLRVRGGSKRWLAQYRVGSDQHREILGDIRKVRLDDARKAARRLFARIELGHDPAAERDAKRLKATAARLTLGVVAGQYLDAKKAQLRSNTYRDAERYLTLHWAPLRDHPIGQIKRADVAARLQDIIKERGPVAAARARENLSALFGWAMREGLCDTNPVALTNDPAKGRQSRERVLSLAELAAIWRACSSDDDAEFGAIVRLLMLTGCRRSEIGGLQWGELDFDRGAMTISAERVKNGRALTLTLPPAALKLLNAVSRRDGHANLFGSNGSGFTTWSSSTRALHERMAGKPLPSWTLHDIRRSVATHMAELGVQPHVIEALLNHVSGHKRGVAGIYNRASYQRETTAALQLWAEHLTAVIAGRKSKIVPLKRA